MERSSIIVLCHEVNEYRNLSQETKERVERGIRLYSEDDFCRIIMSGGHIKGYEFSVAEIMADYASGKTSAPIILEDLSLDTAGQLVFLKEGIFDPKGIRDIHLITHDWHMPKTEFMSYVIFGEDYRLSFSPVGENNSRGKRREDTLKIPQFLTTFRDFREGRKDLVTTLLENHPFYNGNYPHGNFSPEYFRRGLEKLKEGD